MRLKLLAKVYAGIQYREQIDVMRGRLLSANIASPYQAAGRLIRWGVRSTVVRNAASLYLIQFANYIIPLIMVPYLVRVLGPAGYGAVAFAQGFVNYLMLFVEYGFDWSATRRISVLREERTEVNRIAINVWAAKGLLSLLGLAILASLVWFVPKLREVSVLLLALYGLILGNALFPTWIFQGMERMVSISVINLGMKLTVLAGVFLLVKRPDDALIYAALMGSGSVLAGLAGVVVAFRVFGLRLMRVSLQGVWEVLKEGWVLFLSKASVSLYTTGNAFILGMLTNHTVVGYYSAAEKLVRGVLGLLSPIAQAAFPRFSLLYNESVERVEKLARKMLIALGLGSFGLTVGMIATAPMMVRVLLGPDYERATDVIRILSPIVLNIGLAAIWSTWGLIASGRDRTVLIILLIAGVINLMLAGFLAPIYMERGMAIAALASETFVNISSFAYTWVRGINPIKIKLRRI